MRKVWTVFPVVILFLIIFAGAALITPCSVRAQDDCVKKCARWGPPGCSMHGGVTGAPRCECVRWKLNCPGDPDDPPDLSATLACSQTGNDSWCTGSLGLLITAVEPQDLAITITGTAAGSPFTCSGTGSAECSVSLPDGSGTAVFSAASANGLSTSDSASWKRDSRPPDIGLNLSGEQGANGWYVSNVYTAAEASDDTSGLAVIQQMLDESGWQACSDLSLTEGVHTLRLQAVDAAGNLADLTRTIRIDTTPPDLALDLPEVDGRQGWHVSPLTLRAIASDAVSGVEAVEGLEDEGTNWKPLPFPLADGVWPVAVRARDQAGNLAMRSKTLFIDTTPPESLFWSHADGETVSGLVQVSGQTLDGVSGPVSGEISLDGSASWQPVALSGYPATWSMPWDTCGLPNGSYTLLMRASDEAGNREHTARLTLVVGNDPPNITLTRSWPVQGAGKLSVSSSGIPVKNVALTISSPQGGNVTRLSYQPGKWNVVWDGHLRDGSLAPAGSYPVKARACDIFDNCRTVHGTITVSYPVSALTSTPTASPLPSPTDSPTSTPPPKHPPARTPIVRFLPPVEDTLELPPAVAIPRPALPPLWPLLTTAGLCLCFAVVLLSDPRPAALRSLAHTLKPNLEN